MGFSFETVIEKLGRILARQYNIEVLFEGNQAYTDGKKIVLPFFSNIDEELQKDLVGYLDHEVGHCKFTDFKEVPKVISRLHKELLNATEDVRIEREMIKTYPGAANYLGPLNTKCRAKVFAEDNWSKLAWPMRVIMAVRDLMEGYEPRIDADIARFVEVVKDAAVELNDCQTTEQIRIKTEEIIKKIIDERKEEKKEEDKDGKGKDGEGSKGEEKSKGEKGEKSTERDASPGEGEESESESDSEGESSSDRRSPKHDKLLTGSPKEFDTSGAITSVHDMINEELREAITEEAKELAKPAHKRDMSSPVWESRPSVPSTTRFDQTTDHSGKGSQRAYALLKREVSPLVSPIKKQLERVLKVKENAKWSVGRERGSINTRDLARLATDRNYRTPFKEYTKTETNNVAVEILVDLSGSMCGRMRTAKQAAIAMAEALKDLDIPFEITGFNSIPDSRVESYSRTLGTDRSRFNRVSERLDLHVFKSFDSTSLTGIEKMVHGQENPDGECVVWAAQRLANRKEKRKILLVLSDGMPSTSDANRGILNSDLKKKVELIARSGVECIGVGIATDCVKAFYPDFIVIDDVTDLPKKAMTKLSKLIAR